MEPSEQVTPSWYVDRVLAAALLVAVVVAIAVGAGRSVWADEAMAILIARQPFHGMVEMLRRDNNFPSYYLLLSIWMRIFGDSEIALRALSAVFYLGGGLVAFALGKHVSSKRRGAWYAALLYLGSPLAIRQAQNIRAYSLLGMLAGLSCLLFIRFFFDDDGSRKTRALLVFIDSIGILTHLWFAFILIAQLLALVIFGRRRLPAWIGTTTIAILPFFALWAPTFLDQLHNPATDWLAIFGGRHLLRFPVDFYGLVFGMLLYGFAGLAFIMAGAKGRAELYRARTIPLLSVLIVGSLAVPLLISLFKPIYYPGRYTIIALAPLAALLAGLLSKFLPRVALPLLTLPLLAAGVAGQVAHRNNLPETPGLPPGQSDRTTARFLLQHAGPGDAIVFTRLTRESADYYFRRAHAEGRFVEVSFPRANAAHPGWEEPSPTSDNRASLETEASSLAGTLQQGLATGRKVWFYDADVEVSNILMHQFDLRSTRVAEHPLSGPYHKRLLEYAGGS